MVLPLKGKAQSGGETGLFDRSDRGVCLRKVSSLQGYPVRWDKTPEACTVKVRHRRAYEGRPHARAEGAHATPPVSDDGELKRETNWCV
jgi:hypothetical protein